MYTPHTHTERRGRGEGGRGGGEGGEVNPWQRQHGHRVSQTQPFIMVIHGLSQRRGNEVPKDGQFSIACYYANKTQYIIRTCIIM